MSFYSKLFKPCSGSLIYSRFVRACLCRSLLAWNKPLRTWTVRNRLAHPMAILMANLSTGTVKSHMTLSRTAILEIDGRLFSEINFRDLRIFLWKKIYFSNLRLTAFLFNTREHWIWLMFFFLAEKCIHFSYSNWTQQYTFIREHYT